MTENNRTCSENESIHQWCCSSAGTEYTFNEFLSLAESFHGFAAPGLLIGGKMVDLALKSMPGEILFDVLCETAFCLPDAVQLLTLCTTGNGWLKVKNLGLFAFSFYDKYTGEGIRVYLDPVKLDDFPEIKTWFYKLKPKYEQDSDLLKKQIEKAGATLFSTTKMQVNPSFLDKRENGKTVNCSVCGEAYPVKHGAICRSCQGDSPYIGKEAKILIPEEKLPVISIPVGQADGTRLIHDMTKIVAGKSKGSEFKKGQTIKIGDVCRLQAMGRENIYIPDETVDANGWVHENEAALAFASRMAGDNIFFDEKPSEGKINFSAAKDGILVIDTERLKLFNMLENVICATRQNYSIMKKGRQLAGTRAIPLYITTPTFQKAIEVLGRQPLFEIKPLKKKKVGILITGNEVYNGLIEDRFNDVVTNKTAQFGCSVSDSIVVPDDAKAIKKGVESLLNQGSELIITTAGLSVDPDDVTRKGLVAAGAKKILYGIPVLPGAMSLVTSIGKIPCIGVPACALYFKTTALDILLPRVLAEIEITSTALAETGLGGFCLQCKICHFPKCSFGK